MQIGNEQPDTVGGTKGTGAMMISVAVGVRVDVGVAVGVEVGHGFAVICGPG